MAEVRTRMRELAEAAADQARPPGAEAAVRRGRRRRRARAAGTAVLLVAMLAAGVGWLRGPLGGAATVPAAAPGRTTASGGTAAGGLAPAAPPGASGRSGGVGWQAQSPQRGRDGDLCLSFRLDVPGAERDRICVPPGTTASLGTGTGFDTPQGRRKPQVAVLAGQVARVRLWYDNPGRYSEFSDTPATTTPGTRTVHGRVDVATVALGSGSPLRVAVLVIPADAGVTRLAAYDDQGRVVCDGDPWAEAYCRP